MPPKSSRKSLGSIFKGLKDYSGTVANTSVVIATGGVEQITTIAIYRCPCVEPSQLSPGCNETSYSLACSQLLNYSYGISFILAPAFALLVFSAAANPKLWKSMTGCCNRSEKYRRGVGETAFTLTTIMLQSLVSPITWICIALVDGQYLACAITTSPYRFDSEDGIENCEDVSML